MEIAAVEVVWPSLVSGTPVVDGDAADDGGDVAGPSLDVAGSPDPVQAAATIANVLTAIRKRIRLHRRLLGRG